MKQIPPNERITKMFVTEFRKHWAGLVDEDTSDTMDDISSNFVADTHSRRRYLAKKFYGNAHVKKMANLTDIKIKKNLSSYLPAVIKYALDEYGDDLRGQKKLVQQLVSGEYALVMHQYLNDPEIIYQPVQDWTGWFVDYNYEDVWYQWTIESCYCDMTILIYKSTGEAFAKKEVDWLEKGIIDNLIKNDDSESLWEYELNWKEANEVYIHILEFHEEDYLFVLDNLIDNLSKSQLQLLLEKVRKVLEEGWKIESKLGKKRLLSKKYYKIYKTIYHDVLPRYIPKNYKHISKKELHNLLSNLWREKALDDDIILHDIIWESRLLFDERKKYYELYKAEEKDSNDTFPFKRVARS